MLQSFSNSNFNVLVVDDEAEFRNNMLIFLKSDGFSVTSAKDGNEALELLKQQNFDIAVIDYYMPEMNGEVLINKIREKNKDIVIILSTAHSGEKPKIEMLETMNIQAYYDKGKDNNEFLGLIIGAKKVSIQIREIKRLDKELEAAKQAITTARMDEDLLREQARLASIGELAEDMSFTIKDLIVENLIYSKKFIDITAEELCIDNVTWEKRQESLKHIKKYSQRVHNTIKHIVDILDTILNYNKKGDFAGFWTDEAKFMIGDVLERIDIFMEDNTKVDKVKKSIDIDNSIEIKGNSINFTQVINTLIRKASHSYWCTKGYALGTSDPNYGRIDFQIVKKDDNVIIAVRDYGYMNKEEKENPGKEMIFARGLNDLGMGLYSAYSVIVEQFNGRIWFECEPDGGTTRYVSVPIYTMGQGKK